MIVVYADESGTHDPLGIQGGSQFPIIELKAAGSAFINQKPETKELSKNPYYNRKWDINKTEAFRLALTKIISSRDIIPIAGAMSIPIFNQSIESQPDKDPYKFCMRQFFAGYYTETQLQWGNFKSEVSFVFDQNENKEWRNSILEIFNEFQNIDTRISGPNFADKKAFQHFPLQAADLFAYRARQHMEDHSKNKLQITPLDKILLRNLLKSAAIKHPHIAHLLK